MIDCKKLAAADLSTLMRGSDDFLIALAVKHDVAEDGKQWMRDTAAALSVDPSCISRWVNKGHLIRDRMIRDASKTAIHQVILGMVPAPKIDTSIPEVRVVAVSRMIVPRPDPIHALQGPSPLQRDPSFYSAEATPMLH